MGREMPGESAAEWDLVFALPNLCPPDSSSETNTLALPSPDDERFVALLEREPLCRKFLSSFVDEHGRQTDCAALLSNLSRPLMEPVYAFRDALALSTVIAEVTRHVI